MAQKTAIIPVTGGTIWNLGKLLTAAGYTGNYQLSYCFVLNANAETVYLHLSDSGNVAPAIGTDGVPINNADAPSKFFNYSQHHPEHFLDVGAAWVYAANTVSIKVLAIGGGI